MYGAQAVWLISKKSFVNLTHWNIRSLWKYIKWWEKQIPVKREKETHISRCVCCYDAPWNGMNKTFSSVNKQERIISNRECWNTGSVDDIRHRLLFENESQNKCTQMFTPEQNGMAWRKAKAKAKAKRRRQWKLCTKRNENKKKKEWRWLWNRAKASEQCASDMALFGNRFCWCWQQSAVATKNAARNANTQLSETHGSKRESLESQLVSRSPARYD